MRSFMSSAQHSFWNRVGIYQLAKLTIRRGSMCKKEHFVKVRGS